MGKLQLQIVDVIATHMEALWAQVTLKSAGTLDVAHAGVAPKQMLLDTGLICETPFHAEDLFTPRIARGRRNRPWPALTCR